MSVTEVRRMCADGSQSAAPSARARVSFPHVTGIGVREVGIVESVEPWRRAGRACWSARPRRRARSRRPATRCPSPASASPRSRSATRASPSTPSPRRSRARRSARSQPATRVNLERALRSGPPRRTPRAGPRRRRRRASSRDTPEGDGAHHVRGAAMRCPLRRREGLDRDRRRQPHRRRADADRRCEVALIPHTLRATIAGDYQPGTAVNVEVDLVARYLARLEPRHGGEAMSSSRRVSAARRKRVVSRTRPARSRNGARRAPARVGRARDAPRAAHRRGRDRAHPRGQDDRRRRRRRPRERGRPRAWPPSRPRRRRSTSWSRTARGLLCVADRPSAPTRSGLTP